MPRTVVRALEGFEKLFDEVSEMKANHEAEKEKAIQAAIAEVEAQFAEKSAKLDELFAKVSVTEELPDEDDEVVEEVAEDAADEVVVEPETGSTITF